MTDPPKQPKPSRQRGPIAWMVQNRVSPNLLMVVLLLGGFLMSGKIKKEVFPDFQMDQIQINVAYPGASPEEVEQGIVLAIEEAISGIEGVEEITARASEGGASITAKLIEGVDSQKVYQDFKQQIDRIRTLPEETEEPNVSMSTHRRFVLMLMIYGEAGERVLRELTEQVRDRLLQKSEITQVDIVGARDYEITVEVPMESLRSYGLTLGDIAQRIRTTAVELPGGSIETSGGEILLRMKGRRDWANEFSRIPIVTTPGGSVVYLGDLAEVREGFENSNRILTYNGKPAMALEIYRVGKQTPIGISDTVRNSLVDIETELPPGVNLAISRDNSEVYRQRLDLLMKNGFIGLVFVLILLTLFFEFKLAFWVTMGIPISFLGALLFLPGFGVSFNMVSMFAFIVSLGIVVDDAIISGENIYEYRQKGMGLIPAAIQGARDVSVPISFSILTNLAAFSPLYFVPGEIGKIFKTIPLVVCGVLLVSWVEALLILPSHLAHTKNQGTDGLTGFLHRWQQKFSELFSRFVKEKFGPILDLCLRHRYLTVAFGIAILMIAMGYAFSGRMGFIFFPKVEADRAVVTAILPYGSPVSESVKVRDRLMEGAYEIIDENGGAKLSEGSLARINENEVRVDIFLTEPHIRPISTSLLTQLWRERVGEIVGLESLRFESNRGGPGRGPSLTVELSHRNVERLDSASASLAESLRQFTSVREIDDGFTPGKEQLNFKLLPEGHSLGLTVRDVAYQVRSAFYGVEALRQQRGRNEIKVMVQLPESQRVNEYDIEQLLLRTPSGRDVPLRQVAQVERGRAFTTIIRHNGRRSIAVTASVVPMSETHRVLATLKEEILPQLNRDYPGLTFSFEGRQADLRKSLGSLKTGFGTAMIVVFILLAVPFRSYIQPIIVMAAIPFGFVGAIVGHIIMGYSLSIISMMGLVALSGVVVNDALVMVDYANRQQRAGLQPVEAIRAAGLRRFRPILLTTLTTFGGLAPMIFETSRQARFMIPMAVSLGYGILFATTITLILVPCLFLIVEDLRTLALGHRRDHQELNPADKNYPLEGSMIGED